MQSCDCHTEQQPKPLDDPLFHEQACAAVTPEEGSGLGSPSMHLECPEIAGSMQTAQAAETAGKQLRLQQPAQA